MKLTEEQILKHDHISTYEIETDILDTEKEIEGLRHDLEGAKARQDRWGIMKAESGIDRRQEFLDHAKQILNYRKK